MKVETFYAIYDDTGHMHGGKYIQEEFEVAKRRLIEFARMHPGTKFHLMARVQSVVSSDLTWEDSQIEFKNNPNSVGIANFKTNAT